MIGIDEQNAIIDIIIKVLRQFDLIPLPTEGKEYDQGDLYESGIDGENRVLVIEVPKYVDTSELET